MSHFYGVMESHGDGAGAASAFPSSFPSSFPSTYTFEDGDTLEDGDAFETTYEHKYANEENETPQDNTNTTTLEDGGFFEQEYGALDEGGLLDAAFDELGDYLQGELEAEGHGEGEGFFEEAFILPEAEGEEGDTSSPTALGQPLEQPLGQPLDQRAASLLASTSPFAPPLASPFASPLASPSGSPSDSRLASPSASAPPSPAVSLSHSLDDHGTITLNHRLTATAPTPSTYTPHPHVLAYQPAAPPDPAALYTPLTTSHFRTSAEAKAHRRRARLAPKSHAKDIARVKALGRDYWVCRIFNAMINSREITDGAKSVHRTRFTRTAAFDALDLEAAAHAVFDAAIAVHERGWTRPIVYHKHTVRGKLVDISGASVELRLSRICLVLGETKSAVDDAVRGGVTLALLCDNPEARRFTKESNNVGNQKRGERLKQTAARERAKEVEAEEAESHVQKTGGD